MKTRCPKAITLVRYFFLLRRGVNKSILDKHLSKCDSCRLKMQALEKGTENFLSGFNQLKN